MRLRQTNYNNTDNSDDEWCEVEERPSGVTDTLLQTTRYH